MILPEDAVYAVEKERQLWSGLIFVTGYVLLCQINKKEGDEVLSPFFVLLIFLIIKIIFFIIKSLKVILELRQE